jgi:hypothetical protein
MGKVNCPYHFSLDKVKKSDSKLRGVIALPYFTIDEKGERREIPIDLKRSDNYKSHYAHGMQGGIMKPYHYRIDFYNDHMPPLSGKIREGFVKPDDPAVVREIEASVYLPLAAAKELRNWLDKNITEYEEKHGEVKMLSDIVGESEDLEPFETLESAESEESE